MSGSRGMGRLAGAMFGVLMLAVVGCGNRHSTETIIGGRPVVYRSTAEKDVRCRVVNQDQATFAVGGFEFTIDSSQVKWGQGQSLALPDGWKRVDLVDRETHIEVKVDGKVRGEIGSATNPV